MLCFEENVCLEEWMEDRMMELLRHSQKELGIRPKVLCEGICTEEMYHMVLAGRRYFDRVTVKRLIARMGLDNAIYDNYLHYSDYCVWLNRTRIINAILMGRVEEAEGLLKSYLADEKNGKESRLNIEKQFVVFMKLQIMRIKSRDEYKKNAKKMYKEALNYTVFDIEDIAKEKVLLSPLELCIAIEYLRRNVNHMVDDVWNMYMSLISYINKSTYGKLAKVKTYPKLIVCMYDDIKGYVYEDKSENSSSMMMKLLDYSEEVLEMLREQKSLLYMTEILEMRMDILSRLSITKEVKERIAETRRYLAVLKELYEEYGVCAYMTNDAYLYRESGNFCIGEVIYKRRSMKKMTQKELSIGICDARTIRREERHETAMQKYYFAKIFDRLKINPNYIDTGIVVEKREQLELYHRVCLADNALKYNEVSELLEKLKEELPEHPINKQVIKRIDSFARYRMGLINTDEHIMALKEALAYTVDIGVVGESIDEIFLTLEEMLIVYLISEAYRNEGKNNEAYRSIKILWEWCKKLEKEELEASRMGIYELIMLHMSSLLGDMGRYDESNSISDKLLKMGLVYKYGHPLHPCLYDQAWNNNQRKKEGFDYYKAMHRCIHLSQLIGDINAEAFYKENLASDNAT